MPLHLLLRFHEGLSQHLLRPAEQLGITEDPLGEEAARQRGAAVAGRAVAVEDAVERHAALGAPGAHGEHQVVLVRHPGVHPVAPGADLER